MDPVLDARDHQINVRLWFNGGVVEKREMLSVLAPFYELNLVPGRSYKVEVDMINRKTGSVSSSFQHSFRSG